MKSSFLQVCCRFVRQREEIEKNFKTIVVENCTVYNQFFSQNRNPTNGLDPRGQNIDQVQLRIMVYGINTSLMTVILKTVRESSVLAVVQKSLDQQLLIKSKIMMWKSDNNKCLIIHALFPGAFQLYIIVEEEMKYDKTTLWKPFSYLKNNSCKQ